ncbi:proline iminopeptidase-family hydrolase [Starkeya koreensis]|uniref:Proline iminopeptidase-family hydrolase n=1 Tax=Ancylobacter koreensis TaxID=266121 RepID=A0ABT0DIF6_9HYPH|nr:proline iminopeptidase-family hydrolase [Ancylobacter koreensis]MCK0207052.1 proline iminopeptidase-family hydrolase [Ancylobacter koreensis]
MWQIKPADERIEVEVDGHRVVAYSYGAGEETVFLLNGGPGLPCDYLRDAHSFLAGHGYRVVAFDQLGCGASDRPDDPALWSIARYVEETEAVRRALGLGRVHLLGHSWGGWLAIDYALAYPGALKTLILEDTAADLPHLMAEMHRLRASLGPETVEMLLAHEADGSYGHPEYQAAITLLNYRHVCRLQDWPAPLLASLEDWNMAPYMAMQGPNEFLYIGNLKDWNRVPDLHRIEVPVLITVGRHDEITPACALRMKQHLPQAELTVFQNSSHMPFYEEPADYDAVLLAFLGKHRGAA